MPDKSIERISLCKVSSIMDGDKPWLIRLADIENGILVKFYQQEGIPPYFDNRDRLHWREGPNTAGSIGVWEWTSVPNKNNPEKDYDTTSYTETIHPIEVFLVPNVYTDDDLAKALQEGIKFIPNAPKVLFCFQKSIFDDSEKYWGVLCSSSNINIVNEKAVIDSSIISLNLYSVSKKDIITLDGKKFYTKFELNRSIKSVLMRDPTDIIRDVIIKRTTWTSVKTLGISKSMWQRIRTVIAEMPDKSLYEEIQDKCQCGEDEAKQQVDRFLSNVSNYIEHDDFDSTVLNTIIESHPKIKQNFENEVSKQWQKENKQLIDQAQTEINTLVEEIHKHTTDLEDIKQAIESQKNKLTEITDSVRAQEKLADDVSLRVQSKIAEARSNAADFLAEMAFTQPFSIESHSYAISEIHSNKFISSGKSVDDENLELLSNWEELIDNLNLELIDAGVAEKYAMGLAAFLYSAFICHYPVLLAGPNSDAIIDAFSRTIRGKTSSIVDCSNGFSAEINDEIEKNIPDIFVFKHSLRNDWLTHLPDFRENKCYFFISHPFAEDLLIEPKSLFSYVHPILTELIVDDVPQKRLYGCKKNKGFKEFDKKPLTQNLYSKLLKRLGISTFTRTKIQKVLSYAHEMVDIDWKDLDCILGVFPYAFIAIQHKTELLEIIFDSISISQEFKKEMGIFLGVENE